MRARASLFVLFVFCGALATAAWAQEGHPLKGSWIGTWGPSEDHTNFVVVIMDWDGEHITGMINPGTDDMPIQNATLDPATWTVRFEAEGQDRSGNPLHYVVEGTIDKLPEPNREIRGTWRHESGSGPFEITRQ